MFGKNISAMKSPLFILLLVASAAGAQKMDSYTASNGVTYNVGDTVKLGRGSDPSGDFLYLQMGGWAALDAETSATKVGKNYSGMAVLIKKIKTFKLKG